VQSVHTHSRETLHIAYSALLQQRSSLAARCTVCNYSNSLQLCSVLQHSMQSLLHSRQRFAVYCSAAAHMHAEPGRLASIILVQWHALHFRTLTGSASTTTKAQRVAFQVSRRHMRSALLCVTCTGNTLAAVTAVHMQISTAHHIASTCRSGSSSVRLHRSSLQTRPCVHKHRYPYILAEPATTRAAIHAATMETSAHRWSGRVTLRAGWQGFRLWVL
jgi:hypothetical protein